MSVLEWEVGSGERPPMNEWQKLAWVQKRLAVPKGRGKGHDKNAKVEYAFRNASDILTAAKPLCFAVDAMVTVDCEPRVLAEHAATTLQAVKRGYTEKDPATVAPFSGAWRVALATAIFTDIETGKEISRHAFAEQDYWRKGQAEPEKRSGSTDSYASKYALGHLFALDDEKDADQLSNEGEESPF